MLWEANLIQNVNQQYNIRDSEIRIADILQSKSKEKLLGDSLLF